MHTTHFKYDQPDCVALLKQLSELRAASSAQAENLLAQYSPFFNEGLFSVSASNLAHYLVLRQYDLRPLQDELSSMGLSSLGRGESYIVENLDRVIHLLCRILGQETPVCSLGQSGITFPSVSGRQLLVQNTDALLGSADDGRSTQIMVTLPETAATDYELVRSLVGAGMNCARINCAHQGSEQWQGMIEQVKKAQSELGRECRIMMDLAGQKIRTGEIEPGPPVHHIKVRRDEFGKVTQPGRILILAKSKFGGEVNSDLQSLFKIALYDDAHHALKPGDQLNIVDIRGKHRHLDIIERRRDGSVIAQCWRGVYLTPRVAFRVSRGGRGKKMEHLHDIPIAEFQFRPAKIRLMHDDQLLLCRSEVLGRPPLLDKDGGVVSPARVPVSHDEVLSAVKVGHTVWFDDGKIGTVVEKASEEGLLLSVNNVRPQGAVLRSDKGINFPDSDIDLPALTEKDLQDLDFIAEHADMVAYSFVQTKEDISLLLDELKTRNAPYLPIIAKIETNTAVKNLPDLILSTIGRTQLGVMIARGDLAVELGSVRMAEIQEQILWLCEAAHVPVIWATQVLETLAKQGVQSRPEITDAAMSVRAECVMLNKGPHILSALSVLDDILRRMQEHQDKKTSRLRALQQWAQQDELDSALSVLE